jgi:hypothetical protein
MGTTGIFQLKTAADLAAKMRHDLERLRKNPSDTYAAFDFFVAARHFAEWRFPNDRRSQNDFFAQHVELRICRHLADGAKHFELHNPQHQQVRSTVKTAGAWDKSWYVWAPGVWGDGLTIKLDDKDPGTKQFGAQLTAIQLAERVMPLVEVAI